MKTELILMRHGQTDWNKAGRLQGRTDIPLNETGRAQARAAGQKLSGIPFDVIYASPLRRAVETACLAAGAAVNAVRTDERLIEISFGVLEGTDERQFDPQFFLAPQSYVPPRGGEGFPAVCDRTQAFLREILARHRGQRLLVVSHGAALACLLLRATGGTLAHLWDDFNMANCATVTVADDGAGPYIARPLCAAEADALRPAYVGSPQAERG